MKKNLLKSVILGVSLSILSVFSNAQLIITPASGPNLCDGTAAISNPSGVILSSITWYGNGMIIATNAYQVGNLCPGSYGVFYNQSNPAGGIDSLNATFFIMGGTNPCASFNVTLNTTPCSSVSSNDGAVFANATGGTAPYSFVWNMGATIQNPTNLPAGYNYCVQVTDVNGCQLTVCDSMTVSGSNTGDTLVVNNTNCGPAAVGNFVQQFEDCNFDFNACTSASMTSSTIIGNDTLQTVWTFVDSMNVTIGTYTINYYIPNGMANGCVNLQFILYCPIKSSNIKTIVVNDMSQLSGLNEMVQQPFSVINPMGNELSVQFDEVTTGTLRLYNMNGQLVKSHSLNSVKEASMLTTQLPAGPYFMQLEVGTNVYTQKVIK
ncbi:MAG: T9SS type A sorting domain-containing protein [Flavobacteriales bacterium]